MTEAFSMKTTSGSIGTSALSKGAISGMHSMVDDRLLF